VLDNRLPAPSRNDHRDYKPQPAVEGAPPVAGARPLTFAEEMRRKLLRRACAFALLLSIYPVCVIAFTWSHVLRSDLKGGRHGQLDAYRHALASATVSYTLGEWAVNVTTWIFESGEKDSNKMDIHNNHLGARLGVKAESFSDIEPAVRSSVLNGTVSSVDSDQITWLPSSRWRDGKLW